MRTSSIRLRAHSRIAVLYEDYLEICDGNMLAAMLLSTLVYWTDVKIAQKDENKWIWKTQEGFQEDLMFDKPGMKPPHRTTISSALELLKRKDFIEWRKNPKMALDRTRQYLIHQEVIQASIDKLPTLESRKSDKGMSEKRLSEEQATEAGSEQSSNVGKTTMQSRNSDNALSENQHSNVGKTTSNTSDYSYSDYSPVITEEGTYRASGSQGQECAVAQPAPASSSDSYSLTTTEDTDGQNHTAHSAHSSAGSRDHRPGDLAAGGTVSGEQATSAGSARVEVPAATTQRASTTSQQQTAPVTPAGGSGYKQDEKPAGGKRGGRKASEEKAPAPEFTEGGRKVNDAWASLFKSPPSVGPKTIECANALYAQLMPWCRELKVQCRDLLDEIKKWEYATDPDYYRRRGVALCDIHRDFERWQSVKTEALEQEKRRAANPTASPLFDTSAIEQMRANRLRYAGGMQA